MTKLQEWLGVFTTIFAIWFVLITNKLEISFVKHHYNFVLYSPFILVIVFGLYALAVVLYRVYTFNDCKEAAAELQMDIREAREDLLKLGFKFKEKAN